MCTLIIQRRPSHPWPLLLAGNRDEMRERPWLVPDRHWEDRPEVTAPRDLLAGGSWMGVNDHGMAVVIMNRRGSLGPQPGKRSRGELVLEALDHAEAGEAARALAQLAPAAYRPFNLIVADPVDTWWLRNNGSEIRVSPVTEGLHMLSAGELDDPSDPRIGAFLPRFRAAPVPRPDEADWSAWQHLLGDTRGAAGEPATAAMSFQLENGFGTLSSSCIALPAHPGPASSPRWLFAAGAPGNAPFEAVDLAPPR
jgi:uncharacterized protein with NRDE domain